MIRDLCYLVEKKIFLTYGMDPFLNLLSSQIGASAGARCSSKQRRTYGAAHA